MRLSPSDAEDLLDLAYVLREMQWKPRRISPELWFDPYMTSTVHYEALLIGMDELWIHAVWGRVSGGDGRDLGHASLAHYAREAAGPLVNRRRPLPAEEQWWRDQGVPDLPEPTAHPEGWVNRAGEDYVSGLMADFQVRMQDGDLEALSEVHREARHQLHDALSGGAEPDQETRALAAAYLLQEASAGLLRQVVQEMEQAGWQVGEEE